MGLFLWTGRGRHGHGGEPSACQYLLTERRRDERVARVEFGGRREGQEVWARWIDGTVQGDREFLKVAGLDPDTRFEDPHAFVELIQGLLDCWRCPLGTTGT